MISEQRIHRRGFWSRRKRPNFPDLGNPTRCDIEFALDCGFSVADVHYMFAMSDDEVRALVRRRRAGVA